MSLYFLDFTDKVYAPAPEYVELGDLSRVYPDLKASPSYDKDSEAAKAEYKAALAHFEKLAPLSAVLEDPTLTQAEFVEIKHALEDLVNELLRAKDRQENEFIEDCLGLIQHRPGLHARELVPGQYQRNEQNVWTVVQQELPAQAGLGEFLKQLPTMARIYKRSETQLAMNYPPLIGQGFERSYQTVTQAFFGAECMTAYHVYPRQVQALLKRIETLSQDPRINYLHTTLIKLMSDSFYFAFVDQPNSLLNKSEASSLVNLKQKIEKIVEIMLKKFELNKPDEDAQIKSLLTELCAIFEKCGTGIFENVTQMLADEQLKNSSNFDLATVLAEFRTACVVDGMAGDHIKAAEANYQRRRRVDPNAQRTVQPWQEIHVKRYYIELALYHKIDLKLDKEQVAFKDNYITGVVNAFGKTEEFPRNDINAKRSDLEQFKETMKLHFNERRFIARISDLLSDRFETLFRAYVSYCQGREDLTLEQRLAYENDFMDKFIAFLELQGLPKNCIDTVFIRKALLKLKTQENMLFELQPKRQRDKMMKIVAVAIIVARGWATLTPSRNSSEPEVFNIHALIVGRNKLPLPPSAYCIPDELLIQWAQYGKGAPLSRISTLDIFFSDDIETVSANFMTFLAKIQMPSLGKHLIETLEHEIAEKKSEIHLANEGDDESEKAQLDADLSDLKKLRVHAITHYCVTKNQMNEKILHGAMVFSDQPPSYAKIQLQDLVIEDYKDLEKVFATGANETKAKLLVSSLHRIPGFREVLVEGLRSERLRPLTLFFITEVSRSIHKHLFTLNNDEYHRGEKGRQFLAEILDSAKELIPLEKIPSELRHYLTPASAAHYLKTVNDLAVLFPRSQGEHRFDLMVNPRLIAHVLPLIIEADALSIEKARALISLKRKYKHQNNIHFMKKVRPGSNYNQGLFFENIDDINELLNQVPEQFCFHLDHNPLVSLFKSNEFGTIVSKELRAHGYSVKIQLLFGHLIKIAKHSQYLNQHLDIFKDTFDPFVVDILIPVLGYAPGGNLTIATELPPTVVSLLTQSISKALLSMGITTFQEWIKTLEEVRQALNYETTRFLTVMHEIFIEKKFIESESFTDDLQVNMNFFTGTYLRYAIIQQYLDEGRDLGFLFGHLPNELRLHFLPAMLFNLNEKLHARLADPLRAAELDALMPGLISYCTEHVENVSILFNNIHIAHWPWMMENLGLTTTLLDFSWIDLTESAARVAGLNTLAEHYPELKTTQSSGFSRANPVLMIDLLTEMVAVDENYDSVAVVDTLSRFMGMRYSLRHFPIPNQAAPHGLHADISFEI